MTDIISPLLQIKEYWKERNETEKGNEVRKIEKNIFRATDLVNAKIQAQQLEKFNILRQQVSSQFCQLNNPSSKLKKQYTVFDRACDSLNVVRADIYKNSLAEGNEKFGMAVEKLQVIANELKKENLRHSKKGLTDFFASEIAIYLDKESEKKKNATEVNNAIARNLDVKFINILNKLFEYAKEKLPKNDYVQFKKRIEASKDLLKAIINVDSKIAIKIENETQPGSKEKEDHSSESNDKHIQINYWEDPASIAKFFEFICKKPFLESYQQDTKALIQEVNLQYEKKNAVREAKKQAELKPITLAQAHRMLMQRYGLKPETDKKQLLMAANQLLGGAQVDVRDALSPKIHKKTNTVEPHREESSVQTDYTDAQLAKMQERLSYLRAELALADLKIAKLKSLQKLHVNVVEGVEHHAPSFTRHGASLFTQQKKAQHATIGYAKMAEMHPLVLDLVKKLRFHIYSFIGKHVSGKHVSKQLKEFNEMINTIAASGSYLPEAYRIVNHAKQKAEKTNPALFTLLDRYEGEMKNALESNAVSTFKVVKR